jgi:DNA-directed RNA polymerase specialized sigma24 family protein
VTTEARAALRHYVAEPATRSSITAYMRRRGLHEDADDLAQTVLCAALAVEAVPDESSDWPRWLTGIAKRKAADERRRRARWKQDELPDLGAATEPEVRDLLRRIDAEVVDHEDRRSLGWLMREHAGETLFELAREEAIHPATLRQRICRLRRQLRARYAWPLLVLLGVGLGVCAAQRVEMASLVVDAVAPKSVFEGNWRVVDAEPHRYPAIGWHVVVSGRVVRVLGANGAVERKLTIDTAAEDRLVIRSGDSLWNAAVQFTGSDHVKLTTPRGFVELERVP